MPKTPSSMKFQTISGPELQPFLQALGQLRIQVFREFPYLYDGDLEYEKKYLARYLRTSESRIQLLFSGDTLVGAATAILAKHEESNPLISFLGWTSATKRNQLKACSSGFAR
jgi:hypothetical protein